MHIQSNLLYCTPLYITHLSTLHTFIYTVSVRCRQVYCICTWTHITSGIYIYRKYYTVGPYSDSIAYSYDAFLTVIFDRVSNLPEMVWSFLEIGFLKAALQKNLGILTLPVEISLMTNLLLKKTCTIMSIQTLLSKLPVSFQKFYKILKFQMFFLMILKII